MRRWHGLGLVTLASAAAGIALVWACNGDVPAAPECKDIPAGGCPSSFGSACDDPTCAVLYVCTSVGAWSKVRECPARDAGPDASASDDGSTDAPADTRVARDVDIDAPGEFGGPGCQDLQPPDCPLGIAASCPNGCCGCEDLFVCSGGGWNAWGFCGDGGALIPR